MRLTDTELIDLFSDKLGDDRVISFWDDQLSPTLQNFWGNLTQGLAPDSLPPACIIFPQSIEELSQAIAIAYSHHLRILPCGNGTKLDWGGLVSRADVVISTARLNQVIEHCVGDLTVTVQAGVKYADLQTVLAKEGQFLAIDPAYGTAATIGGIIATGSTGSLRHRYNGVRDMCLGIEFCRSDGALVKAGGRVVKNVAGYDLMKLLTGSYGTLGITTTATFRLYPLPDYRQVVMLVGESQAIAAAQRLISKSVLTPVTCDLLSSAIANSLNTLLNLGLATNPENMGLALQFASLQVSVEEQCDRVVRLAKDLGLQAVVITEVAQFEQSLGALLWQERQGQTSHLVCKLGMLPTEAVSAMVTMQNIFVTDNPEDLMVLIHAGSGLGTLRLAQVTDPLAIADQIKQLRQLLQPSGGFVSILESPQDLKFKPIYFALDANGQGLGDRHQTLSHVWGYRGNAQELMGKLQQKFDPRGLLSCDRL
ncbi:MAG: FAD-binding oxidoreductase [Pseudanabaenaceae cyanobacterium bins.39]|nr:FAD-binding oxidoreductase [Pseudanabaenaceae cyanobacterium bins.39]